jgi:hypothetical protein
MATPNTSTSPQDVLELTLAEVGATTETAVIAALPEPTTEEGVSSSAATNFNRRTAAATFGAVLEAGVGDGLWIALAWNGARFAFQSPDGSTPIKGEVAAGLIFAATHGTWRGFVERLLKKLTGLVTFPPEQLTPIKELMLGVTDTVAGGGLIGALFTLSTILAEGSASKTFGSQILGIVGGFLCLGAIKLMVQGLGMQDRYITQIDNKPLSAVLTSAIKHELRDFISFRAWWKKQIPDILTFGLLGVWIDPFITSVGGTKPPHWAELGTNIALLATFFAQTDTIVAILKHGPPAAVNGKNAVVARYRAITRD